MLLNLGGVAPSWAAAKNSTKLAGKVSEVSPPSVIQQLKPLLDKYQPQVSIVSPRPNEILQDDTVSIQFNLKDLPIYKDEKLGLGSHLHVFLDDQPYRAVYDVSQPVVFKDLAAGTHTIRAFAGRPWHESFKNDGAYAQTTFHVFTKTPNNNPDPKLPLLTYNRPQATYGAEPILLDFYLNNAPLHIVAQENDKDDVADWRVKVTVNGDSFMLDRWQPIYLKGFKPGKNWVQLEYVDEKGNPVPNVYNNTARVFNYEPNGEDALSKLVRGEIPFDQAVSIVDRNYKPAVTTPEVTPTPEATPIVPPVVEKEPAEPEVLPPNDAIKEVTEPAEAAKPKRGFFNRSKRSEPKPTIAPSPEPTPELEEPLNLPETIEPEPTKVPTNAERGASIVAPEPEEPLNLPETIEPEPSISPEPVAKPKGGFFNRFKRKPSAVPPVVVPSPEPSAITEPEAMQQPETIEQPEEITQPETPAVKSAPGGFFNRSNRSTAPTLEKAPTIEEPPTIEESQPEVEPVEPETIEITPAPEVKAAPKKGFFDRFKRSESKPPSVLPSPTSIPEDLSIPEAVPEPIETEPVEPETIEITPAPEVKAAPKESFFDRFKRSEPKPVETPVPEITEEVPTVEEEPIAPFEPADIEPVRVVKESPKAKETPTGSLFVRFKRSESKPPIVLPSPTPVPDELSTPEIEAPEPVETKPIEPEAKSAEAPIQETNSTPEEPTAEATPEATSSDFEPQTELERRLGMPLKPRVSQPAANPK
jgi:hypothetical protein